MKFETLDVDNTSPVAKVPGAYVATIEGLKMVPKGWELNALSNSGMFGSLLENCWLFQVRRMG